jgi:predicted DNA-binding transcriptional regulator AlpA
MKNEKFDESSIIFLDTLQRAIKKLQEKEADLAKEFIGDEELRERLGVSRTTLYNWRREGIIPYKRIGNKIFYPWKAIQEIMGQTL